MLADELGINVVIRGSSCLIPFEHMETVLEACKIKGFTVLGIDGFWKRDGALVPEMDVIADFSTMDSPVGSFSNAICFIRTMGKPGMFFELVISQRTVPGPFPTA